MENVKIAARVGAELGADIVKVPWTGSADALPRGGRGSFLIPVVIAGGIEDDRRGDPEDGGRRGSGPAARA
ncbi:MAG: hypothetical protein MZU91_06805 [Desulfosudis oleivorans]|nr:hypothetical protein [Desulfosudis oleivorans]